MWHHNDDYYPTYRRYEFEVNVVVSRKCSVWIPSNIKDEDDIRNVIRYSTDIEVIDEKLEDYDIIDIIETEDVE